MNLEELFKMQGKLDEHITREKGLEGQSLLDKKILALQVELGELANEWRRFKFWSNDQEPRTKVPRYPTMNYEDIEWINPLLEEYVDCLHFFLSIGIETGNEDIQILKFTGISKERNIVDAFLSVFECASALDIGINRYALALSRFVELGEMLGFTWEQIEQAYIEKNKINHQRQDSGY